MANFYLHEDDWGMINLIPAENAVWAEGVVQEAERVLRENFAGFAQLGDVQIPTYHNAYVVPEVKHPISERGIRLEWLRTLLANRWAEAKRVTSGYSSTVEETSGTFAFGRARGDAGAFYGSHRDGIITGLHAIRPPMDDARAVDAFQAALEQLGEQYNLVLADWWARTVLDLRDTRGIRRYLKGET